ncbi:MAG: flagellar motor switch protein FliN [Treponema sp.]|nr:flagellar motor switch protein FliN [Treponema sp.]
MSDGAISQDEIDALLSGVAIDGLNSSGHVGNGPSFQIDIPTLLKFAEDLQPKLEENVNKFTGASFKVGTPIVEFSERDKVLSKLPEVVVTVSSDYSDSAKGNHIYLLSSEFALKLFALTNNEEASEVDDMVLSVVSEVIATYISSQITILDATGKLPGLSYSTPESINESKAMIMFPQGEFALISYPVTLDSNAYTLWECIGGEPAEKISNALGGNKPKAEDPPALDAAMQSNMMDLQGASMNAAQGGMQNMGMPNMQMNMGMQNMGMPNMQMNMGMPNMGQNMGMNVPNIQSLQFPNLQAGISSSEQGNIGLIMDVFMEMTVELGRTKKSIKDILGMGEGTIIELDKLAGEPVDILVNHKPIAKGEVVVIDENFGVRVTEILSPMERVSDIN